MEFIKFTQRVIIKNKLLYLIIVILNSCYYQQSTDMKKNQNFKTVKEIKSISGNVSSKILEDEYAETIPVPRYSNGELVIQILYYPAFGPPNDRRYLPPTHCMFLDPVTGKVLKFWACSLKEIDMEGEIQEVPGTGISHKIPFQEYLPKEKRFFAIGHLVWEAFSHGDVPKDSDIQKMVKEYRQLFIETSTVSEAKYTLAGAPDFFKWLDEVSKQ